VSETAAPAPQSPRRRARILALQALYEADLVGHNPVDALAHTLAEESEPPAVESFARHLVNGVQAHRAAIDETIQRAAPAWPLTQMPAIDKSLLRLAIYEVLFDNRRVPLKAAINEAVEIAKAYGSENSSRFVNGVLGTVVAGQDKPA
jgi:N utilization substance protein B